MTEPSSGLREVRKRLCDSIMRIVHARDLFASGETGETNPLVREAYERTDQSLDDWAADIVDDAVDKFWVDSEAEIDKIIHLVEELYDIIADPINITAEGWARAYKANRMAGEFLRRHGRSSCMFPLDEDKKNEETP